MPRACSCLAQSRRFTVHGPGGPPASRGYSRLLASSRRPGPREPTARTEDCGTPTNPPENSAGTTGRQAGATSHGVRPNAVPAAQVRRRRAYALEWFRFAAAVVPGPTWPGASCQASHKSRGWDTLSHGQMLNWRDPWPTTSWSRTVASSMADRRTGGARTRRGRPRWVAATSDPLGRTELSNRAGTKTLREPFLAGASGGRDAGALLMRCPQSANCDAYEQATSRTAHHVRGAAPPA